MFGSGLGYKTKTLVLNLIFEALATTSQPVANINTTAKNTKMLHLPSVRFLCCIKVLDAT